MKYEVIFYEDTDGNSPVDDFITDLAVKGEAGNKDARVQFGQIYHAIERLEEGGTRCGVVRPIEGIKLPMWEIKPGTNRIFLFAWNGNHFVLCHQFEKKSQKTPKKEIVIAERRMLDWLDRHGN